MIRRLARWVEHQFFQPKGKPACDAELLAEIRGHLERSRAVKLPSEYPLKEMKFVVFDTETTGFHPYAGDELLSIGAVVVQNGEVLEEATFHEWINPQRPVPKEIQELLSITEDCLAEAPSALEAINRFLQFAGSACLVAHNLDFDLHFLNRQLKTCCKQKIPNHSIDTFTLAYHLYPTLGSHTLDSLLDVLGIPLLRRHHALDDALMTAQLFVQLLKAAEERGIHSLYGLEYYIYRHASQGFL